MMPFTKQHSAYAWVVTCILFLTNFTFHNLSLRSSYKIHQPFTEYFLQLPYSELFEKQFFFPLSGQPSSILELPQVTNSANFLMLTRLLTRTMKATDDYESDGNRNFLMTTTMRMKRMMRMMKTMGMVRVMRVMRMLRMRKPPTQ